MFEKEAPLVCGGLLILMMSVLGLHIDFDYLEDEASTPEFTPMAALESSSPPCMGG
jgi:hypothetical protein